ncbi:hypothetical protein [Streptomyces sp. HC307]|uniref:hypothetical protein n=1 Tax=Streptomyces flavusporus TaxID=3385496 RepID=UPI0039173341
MSCRHTRIARGGILSIQPRAPLGRCPDHRWADQLTVTSTGDGPAPLPTAPRHRRQ